MKINIKNIRVKSICATLFIFLFLSCNNGIEELQKQKDSILSISNLRQNFLDIFTSFGDMITDSLGINPDTKKSDIGKYFTDIATTIKTVKDKLQSEVVKNEHYSKVKEAVEKFIEKLTKIEEGSKGAAEGVKGDAISGATASSGQNAAPAKVESVNSLVKGIKTIVDVVIKKGEGNPAFTKTDDTELKSVGKLFSDTPGDATETIAAAASASIGAVTGADILQAIAGSEEAKDQPNIEDAKNAAEIAVTNKNSGTKTLNKANKDAVLVAGIALRAMAEGGKLAAKNDAKSSGAVNGVAASVVNKTLSTLIIAIRNTVDSGLKTISEALATVKQGDMSAETATSGQ
ncbi:variable large family protein (plasmid) [Borrelia coriaceae]|uniref:variable large family protein n=1 Tax=Borrelia coriaceae TaxID=144 RepID=UPI000483D168|nr:variable large family protein [Borrelia coriaceae]UPA17122.1 variable large family protein [Borrelia coriaceae]